jgi:aerobic carbon-monoxide dehydrogenase large subunit
MLALKADVLADVGAYSIYPWTAVVEPVQTVSFMPGPYRLQNYRARARGVATNKAPTGAYRGVGRPISAFVMESLVDRAARRLKIDPTELRLRNYVRPEECFPTKWRRESCGTARASPNACARCAR